jgi:hypothetical protein
MSLRLSWAKFSFSQKVSVVGIDQKLIKIFSGEMFHYVFKAFLSTGQMSPKPPRPNFPTKKKSEVIWPSGRPSSTYYGKKTVNLRFKFFIEISKKS